MKKLLILIVFLTISVGGFFVYRNFYQNYGFLIVNTYPLNTTLKINNQTFDIRNGTIKIKLKPGEYELIINDPLYYEEKRMVKIEPKSTIQLETIYLLPKTWTNNNLINNEKVEFFIPNPQNNLILYLVSSNKKYDWYLYNRATKENIKIYQSNDLPLKILFSNDKRIITELKNLNWKLVFTEKSLINNNGLDLNETFLNTLKKQQTLKKDFKINDIIVSINDNKVIINTNDGIYSFDYIALNIEKIFDEQGGGLISDGNYLYFIQKNGLLTKEDIVHNNLENVSLFKFYNGEDDLNKIRIFKDEDNDFVIITPSLKYLLLNNENVPRKLDFNFDKIAFNVKEKLILFFDSSTKNIILYDINQRQTQTLKILPDNLPYWFINKKYLLFSFKNNLYLYDLNKEIQYPIKDNIKNNLYYYDKNLNYIFYLDQGGIEMISY